MKKRKRFIIISAAVLVLIGAAVGVTIAFFTAQQQAYNDVTVGENTIEIVEDFDPPEEQKTGENEFLKSVLFKNTGNIPCYIRARLEFSSSEIMDLSELSAKGTATDHPVKDDYVPAKSYSENIEAQTNGDWVYKDGYYYFTKQVDAGSCTSNLVRWVKTTYGADDSIQRYDIIVYAESVQVYSADGEIYTYSEAWENFS